MGPGGGECACLGWSEESCCYLEGKRVRVKRYPTHFVSICSNTSNIITHEDVRCMSGTAVCPV